MSSRNLQKPVRKLVHFMRHAQALHNPKAEELRKNGCTREEFLEQMRIDDAFDACLTPLGQQQAKSAGKRVCPQKVQQVELIVTSPLSRAIETSKLAFPSLQRRHILVESFREINGWLLNAKRRSRADLAKKFPDVDSSLLTPEDEDWTDVLEEESVCAQRAFEGLKWMMEQKEENILLVAHGGIFAFMMDHPLIRADEAMGARFSNCELRSCEMTCDGDVLLLTRVESDFLLTEKEQTKL